jgi:hypothetical protein
MSMTTAQPLIPNRVALWTAIAIAVAIGLAFVVPASWCCIELASAQWETGL